MGQEARTTVYSEDDTYTGVLPRSISINSRSSTGAKRYRITRVPLDIESFEKYCFTTIGQGPCICYAQNCATSHQGAVIGVKRGELLVAKGPTTVFGEPRINAAFLSEALLSEWITKTLPLEEWEKKFRSASYVASEGDVSVTAADVEVQQSFAERAEAYKTPKSKRKRESLELPAAIGISPYKRQTIGEEDFSEKDPEETLQLLIDTILGLDAGLDQTSSAVVRLFKVFDENVRIQDLGA